MVLYANRVASGVLKNILNCVADKKARPGLDFTGFTTDSNSDTSNYLSNAIFTQSRYIPVLTLEENNNRYPCPFSCPCHDRVMIWNTIHRGGQHFSFRCQGGRLIILANQSFAT